MISKEFLRRFTEMINPEGKELIFEFFITFSRFECALINTDLFRNVNQNKVTANWDRFTSLIDESFDRNKNPEIRRAVDYLITNSPKIRLLENNQIVWLDRIIDANLPLTSKLGLHIRTVRNNLFHGGKFNGVYQPELSRNYTLIESSLIILNDWLTLHEEVQAKFLERLD